MSKKVAGLGRTTAKILYFVFKGVPWKTAAWLAQRDAPIAQSYKGVRPCSLESYWSAACSWQDLVTANGVGASKALGLRFGSSPVVSAGYNTFISLAERGWRFSEQEDGSIVAENEDLRLNLCTAEECDMLREIFLDGCYNLILPGKWTVLDIGGNVGMAALYFAGLRWVESVVSYEPFQPTAAAFRQNLELNKERASKITLINQGVGEKQEELEVGYAPELRGSMSLTGVGSWRAKNVLLSSVETIELVAADYAARAAAGFGKDVQLLAKIDCEGSEYGVMRRLKDTDSIRLFSAFLIEWHGRGPTEITQLLNSEGFAVREQALSLDIDRLGLICAVRLPTAPA